MPTTYFVKTIGPYALGDQVASVEEELVFREQSVPLAGIGGRFSAGTLFEGLFLTLSGVVLATDAPGGDPNNPASIRSAWDTLKGALISAGSLPLSLDSDRYANVRLSQDIKSERWTGMPSRGYSLVLVSREDPPWWAVTPTTQNGLGPGRTALATLGNGPADPVLSVPVSAVGGAVQIADTLGNALTLTPDATGTYLLDSAAETVTLAGLDKTSCLSAGTFVRLAPGGTAALTLTPLNGFAFSACSATWKDRWY